jgi:hypothetical protein
MPYTHVGHASGSVQSCLLDGWTCDSNTKVSMKLKTILIGTIALAATTGITCADLGDTLASAEAKYGKGVRSTVFSHEVDYQHNGWVIQETYNDSGICVHVEFIKQNGYITPKNRRNMDTNNLPSYTNTINGNGWVKSKWPDKSNMKDTFSFTWTNGNVSFQVFECLSRYGDSPTWYSSRTYVTPEGVAMIKQENAEHDAAHNGQSQTQQAQDAPVDDTNTTAL